MGTIVCGDEVAFFDAIASLVQRGLGFSANLSRLTITLTGAI